MNALDVQVRRYLLACDIEANRHTPGRCIGGMYRVGDDWLICDACKGKGCHP